MQYLDEMYYIRMQTKHFHIIYSHSIWYIQETSAIWTLTYVSFAVSIDWLAMWSWENVRVHIRITIETRG